MVMRQEIADETWAVLEPLFPKPKGRGRPMMDMRSTVEGIAWRFRTGAPWRDVPERFGHWNSIYQRFSTWSADGTWARVLATVQTSSAAAGQVDWIVSVDSTITRATGRRSPAWRAARRSSFPGTALAGRIERCARASRA